MGDTASAALNVKEEIIALTSCVTQWTDVCGAGDVQTLHKCQLIINPNWE